MKLVTFNIRLDCGSDGKNNFEFRKPIIQKKLETEQPDLLCFQEVLPHVALWLKEILPEFSIVGCGREQDLTGEQTMVAVRSSKFQIFSMQTFWLSETPLVSGSRYPNQSSCPRTATELVLQELETGELYHLINTHLDHESSEARVCGMQQILKRFEETGSKLKQVGQRAAHQILTGDFNALPDAPEISMMKEQLKDVTEGIELTFHDFGREKTCQKIDYIAVSKNIICDSLECWKDCENGVYLSDHYPVAAVLRVCT